MIVIGDVHGRFDDYLGIINDAPHSVQVGDFGYDYACLNNVDAERHRIVAGNHDNYADNAQTKHFLGDYGTAKLGDVQFFFVRGEMSRDSHIPKKGSTSFQQRMKGIVRNREELSYTNAYSAVEAYMKAKPQIVISHGCPVDAIKCLKLPNSPAFREKDGPSRTAQMLQTMFDMHQPELWIFGHYHQSRKFCLYNKTDFVCLNELEVYQIS